MRVNWVEQAPVLAQAGLDSLYDTYAFGREGDLKKGIVAGATGIPTGLGGAYLGSRIVPPRFRLAGSVVGNFFGSIAGSEAGIRGLDQFRTATNYRPIAQQPLKSLELQASPVLSQIDVK
jgi:hypothetical protein